MTKFVFVRHGQSLGNKTERFLGHTDLDLSETGYKQAEKTAEYIATHYKIDKIYSSDLLRAYNTALPAAKKLNLNIIKDENLREIYAGEWEGKTFLGLREEFPEDYMLWLEDIGNARCTGGETVAHLLSRAEKELLKLAEENDGKTLLVVTHATFLRAMQCVWKGVGLDRMKNFPWVSNASVSEVDYSNGKWKEIMIGENSFMGELESSLPANV